MRMLRDLLQRWQQPWEECADESVVKRHMLPEEIEEAFLPYRELYMNGEDEEMFERDLACGDVG